MRRAAGVRRAAGRQPAAQRSGIEERLAGLDPVRHPHLAAGAAELAAGPASARLALGLAGAPDEG
ncbi:hypothetical protein [Streptomyces lavendulae]|uniref:hypothetical protein n=1 Tax=Streptomyces lavendulae TaxID=1914 RepID=UPI0036CF9B42